jgi:hypothetical protein
MQTIAKRWNDTGTFLLFLFLAQLHIRPRLHITITSFLTAFMLWLHCVQTVSHHNFRALSCPALLCSVLPCPTLPNLALPSHRLERGHKIVLFFVVVDHLALVFGVIRDDAGEAVGMVCFFVRRPAVQALRDLLSEDVATAAAGDGRGCGGGCGGSGAGGSLCGGCGAEATLALLAPAAPLLPVCEADDVIDEILGILSLVTSPPAALRAKARFVGHMAPWLGQRGEGFMQPAAEVVLGLLFDPEVTVAAADALAELCG